jgi:hypothetical protein
MVTEFQGFRIAELKSYRVPEALGLKVHRVSQLRSSKGQGVQNSIGLVISDKSSRQKKSSKVQEFSAEKAGLPYATQRFKSFRITGLPD